MWQSNPLLTNGVAAGAAKSRGGSYDEYSNERARICECIDCPYYLKSPLHMF